MTTEELLIKISADISELKDGIQKGKKEVEELEKKGNSSFNKFNDGMKSVGATANKAIGIAATAFAAAGTALLALSASTAEYRNNQAKLNTAFEAAGAAAGVAKDTYNDLYRVLGDDGQATEAAQHLAMLTTNEKDLAEWTNICQGIYATFGESLPIESLTEAANETAKTGAITGALADALNWAGVSEEAFQAKLDACNTEAEREALIRTTLNGVYDDAAQKYEKNNANILAQNEAQQKLNDATAKLGEAMAPVNAALAEFAAAFLEEIAPAIQDFVDNYGAELTEGLKVIAEVLGEVISWIVDNIEIISTVAGVILAIVAAINLYNAAMAIYNIVMAPVNAIIIAIIAAIAALVAIIVVVIKYWDEIAAAAKAAWNVIFNAFKGVGEWFGNIFSKAWEGIKKAFSAVGSFFSGIWNTITGIFSKVGSTIANAITGTVKKAINGVLSTAIGIINGFISAINFAIDVINAIPGVNISKLNKLSVPQLARGGIINSATLAVVGEQGKEAVVPLENNTEWLDLLAGRLSDAMGGQGPIILQVDGKTFGQISVDSINQLTRQRGKLALNIV